MRASMRGPISSRSSNAARAPERVRERPPTSRHTPSHPAARGPRGASGVRSQLSLAPPQPLLGRRALGVLRERVGLFVPGGAVAGEDVAEGARARVVVEAAREEEHGAGLRLA